MSELIKYVQAHTMRGECNCGRCGDRGDAPDPEGHTVDNGFFKVAAKDEPTAEEFVALTKTHKGDWNDCNPLDGDEHSYIELGGWIGDQALALQYMALGELVGVLRIMTPERVIPGVSKDIADTLKGMGMVTAQATSDKYGRVLA